MSQIVKMEMRKRLEALIQAAHTIQEASLLDDFEPSKLKKEMADIDQYSTLIRFDLEYLKNPNSEVTNTKFNQPAPPDRLRSR